jgi:alpha-beta hydrolase superfamily lysophospholipase
VRRVQHLVDRITVATDVHLHVEHWAPDEQARGLVVIAHGIAEHISRYRHVAERLVERGWAVVGPDHRGHGRSSGELGMLPDLRVAADDLDQVIAWADPGPHPVVLLGHSMGSLVASLAVLRRPEAWSALVLSGTALDAAADTGAITTVALKGLARVAPSARLVPPLDTEGICSDRAVVRAYEEDPLVDHGRPRLATGLALLRAIDHVRDHAGEIELPTLLIHGVDDPLTPISGAEWLVDAIGSDVVELRRYPGLHEVFNEPVWSEAVDGIADWLDAR